MLSAERKCSTAPSEYAERKTNRQKEKALRNAYRAFPRACGYSVPIGFVPVVVCATILIMTCVERKSGAPVGYGLMEYRIMFYILSEMPFGSRQCPQPSDSENRLILIFSISGNGILLP